MGPRPRESSKKLVHQKRKPSRTGAQSALTLKDSLPDDSSNTAAFEILIRLFGDFDFMLGTNGVIRSASFHHGERKYQPADLVGRRLAEFLPQDHYASLEKLFRQALRLGVRKPYEHSFQSPDGPRWLQSLVIPFRQSKCIVLLLRDVTTSRALQRSRRAETFLAQAGELARVGSFEIDLLTNTLTGSQQLYRNFELDPSQPLTRKAFMDLVHPEDCAGVEAELKHAIEHHHIIDSEFRCVLASGQVKTFHRRALPLYQNGVPVAIVGMSQDVTDRKRAEDELRRREAMLAQAEELADLGSWDWDLQTSKVVWSNHRYKLLGFDPQTQSPDVNAFWDRVHPDDLERVQKEFADAILDARPVEYEARFVMPDGRERILHSRGIPFADERGRVVRIAGMAQDVTERRAEEGKLRRSEDLLAHAEEIAHIGSWEYEIAAGRTVLSRQLLRMYGVESAEKWNTDSFWKSLVVADANAVRNDMKRAIEACQPFEFTAPYRRPDGTTRVYHVVGKTQAGKNGAPEKVLGVVHDITDHIRIEEDLRRLSRELTRARDSERRQLARGLHETAGQTLAALKMTLGNLAEALPEDSAVLQQHLKEARSFAEDAVREIRLVSYLMYPPLLDDAGLGPPLNWYVRGFSQRSAIRANLEVPSTFGRCSQEIENTIFAVVQESLTNAHRYSGSDTIDVRLTREDDSVRVEVQDYGRGLPPMVRGSGQNESLGVGIAGMRERVKQLNGSFEVSSTLGHGTLVRAIVPCSKDCVPASSEPVAAQADI